MILDKTGIRNDLNLRLLDNENDNDPLNKSSHLLRALSIDDDMQERYLGSMRKIEKKLFEEIDNSNKENLSNTQTDEFLNCKKVNILTGSNILGTTNIKVMDESYNSYVSAKDFEIEYNKQSNKTCCQVNKNCLII